MYLIKRVWRPKTGATREVAQIISEMGKRYEDSGQRSATRIYWSGYTVPGENLVYMDWVQEKIESPYREGNVNPDMSDLGQRLHELTEESYIEFYEMHRE